MRPFRYLSDEALAEAYASIEAKYRNFSVSPYDQDRKKARLLKKSLKGYAHELDVRRRTSIFGRKR